MNLQLRDEIVNTVNYFCRVRGWNRVHRQKIAEVISQEHKGEQGRSFATVTREMEAMTENGKQLGGLIRLGNGFYGI